MANLAKYWNPKPKTGVFSNMWTFRGIKMSLQHPKSECILGMCRYFQTGRPIYDLCLRGLLLSKLWVVRSESGGCCAWRLSCTKTRLIDSITTRSSGTAGFFTLYTSTSIFELNEWTEYYAWTNRLLLEATFCSVPVFCIRPSRQRPLSSCTANVYPKDFVACKRRDYCTVRHSFWTISAGIN